MVQNLLIRNILRTYLPITILVSLISTVETFINTFLAAIWLSGEDVVGKTIDHAYKDPMAHQIDVLIRMDDGLNIVIKDDSSGEIDISEDIKQAKSLDLNIYYINIDSKQYSDRSVTAHNS